MNESKRKIFTGTQKARLALEVLKDTKTINEIARKRGVHTVSASAGKSPGLLVMHPVASGVVPQ